LLAAAKGGGLANLAAPAKDHETAELNCKHRPGEGKAGEIQRFVAGVSRPKMWSQKHRVEIAESHEFRQSFLVAGKERSIVLGQVPVAFDFPKELMQTVSEFTIGSGFIV